MQTEKRLGHGRLATAFLVVGVIAVVVFAVALTVVVLVKPEGDGVDPCKTDLKTIQVAVRAYEKKTGDYPPDLDPTLTDQQGFLRPWPGLSGNSLTGEDYTITYDPTTGRVDSGGAC